MTSRIFGGSCRASSMIVFALVLFMPALVRAQEPAQNFQSLQTSLAVGDTIRVSGTDGKTVQGELESASGSSLRLKVHGVSREFREPQVREVRVKYTDSVWDGLGKGALIGLAAGAVLGALSAHFMALL
jgi:preprotein translocase subunit YajC